jgi:hypothetical protein
MHDFKLFKSSKLKINPKKTVKFDSGYQGVEKIHIKSELPKKSSKLKPLTTKQKKDNLKLSKSRVMVEHVIGRVKVFRIMAEKYRNRRYKHSQRMKLICGVYNFEL